MSFYKDLSRLFYSLSGGAGQDKLADMLTEFQSREHAINRMGGSDADHTIRGQLADAIEDQDTGSRPDASREAALLRDPNQHVMVHEGRVVPATYTITSYDLPITPIINAINNHFHINHPGHRVGWYNRAEYPDDHDYQHGHFKVVVDNPAHLSQWESMHISQLAPYVRSKVEKHIPNRSPELEQLLTELDSAPFEFPIAEHN